MKITLVGMGSGAPGSLTAAGLETLRGAELIIGARRLLENLLSNAMKYNASGTTVFVSIREQGNRVVMTLADDGVGIPEEIAHTLFQPFVTGNIARTTGKGTGLGLSIAQRIVQMHQGELSLILPPHAPYHTEFRLSLPT